MVNVVEYYSNKKVQIIKKINLKSDKKTKQKTANLQTQK